MRFAISDPVICVYQPYSSTIFNGRIGQVQQFQVASPQLEPKYLVGFSDGTQVWMEGRQLLRVGFHMLCIECEYEAHTAVTKYQRCPNCHGEVVTEAVKYGT